MHIPCYGDVWYEGDLFLTTKSHCLYFLLFLPDWLHGSVVHYNLVPVNVCLSQCSAAKPRQVALDAEL